MPHKSTSKVPRYTPEKLRQFLTRISSVAHQRKGIVPYIHANPVGFADNRERKLWDMRYTNDGWHTVSTALQRSRQHSMCGFLIVLTKTNNRRVKLTKNKNDIMCHCVVLLLDRSSKTIEIYEPLRHEVPPSSIERLHPICKKFISLIIKKNDTDGWKVLHIRGHQHFNQTDCVSRSCKFLKSWAAGRDSAKYVFRTSIISNSSA